MSFSRRTKWIVVFILVIAVGYGLVVFWRSQNQVPEAFTSARSQGAIIAQNIVNLSNQSTAELQQVNADDEKGDYADALNLTSSMISQSEQLRDEAVQLSNQIQAMTQALSGIGSVAAQQAALESITSRLALINQLVNYSGDLGNLLDSLRDRFSGQVSND